MEKNSGICFKHYVWKFLKYSDRKKIKSSKTKPYTYELYLRVRIGNEVRTRANAQCRTGNNSRTWTTLDRGPLFTYSVFSVRDGRRGKAKSLKRIVAAAAEDGRKSRGSAGLVGKKAWLFFYWFLASYILWYCSSRKFFCCSSSVCWFRRRNSGKRRGETVWRPAFSL